MPSSPSQTTVWDRGRLFSSPLLAVEALRAPGVLASLGALALFDPPSFLACRSIGIRCSPDLLSFLRLTGSRADMFLAKRVGAVFRRRGCATISSMHAVTVWLLQDVLELSLGPSSTNPAQLEDAAGERGCHALRPRLARWLSAVVGGRSRLELVCGCEQLYPFPHAPPHVPVLFASSPSPAVVAGRPRLEHVSGCEQLYPLHHAPPPAPVLVVSSSSPDSSVPWPVRPPPASSLLAARSEAAAPPAAPSRRGRRCGRRGRRGH